MLGAGIDWAESFHAVALGRPGEGAIEQFRIDRTAAGVGRLVARCLEWETGPGDVRAIARDDDRAARDERRLLNRLRADLLAVFLAALAIAGGDLGSPVMLKLLSRWPGHDQLAAADPGDIAAFARAAKHGWPDRVAARVADALDADRLPVKECPVRAKSGTIALTATPLLAIRDQRRAWERRMAELLLGSARHGRAKQPKEPDPGKAIPGGGIYLSFPGLGDRLAARIAGEIGDDITQFDTPNGLQCYGGTAPVTRRSGRSEFVVARRLAHNHYLGTAVHQWAFCSLRRSSWAREFCDAKIAVGKSHHSALPALANRWLEILGHCLVNGNRYDETVPIRNRQHALQPPSAA